MPPIWAYTLCNLVVFVVALLLRLSAEWTILLFAILTFALTQYYNGERPEKRTVDFCYYTMGMVAVVSFYAANRTRRDLANAFTKYDAAKVQEDMLKSEYEKQVFFDGNIYAACNALSNALPDILLRSSRIPNSFNSDVWHEWNEMQKRGLQNIRDQNTEGNLTFPKLQRLTFRSSGRHLSITTKRHSVSVGDFEFDYFDIYQFIATGKQNPAVSAWIEKHEENLSKREKLITEIGALRETPHNMKYASFMYGVWPYVAIYMLSLKLLVQPKSVERS